MEVGQEEPWQCISDFLEQVCNVLAESPVGTSPQVPEQTSTGQSDSSGLRSGVEECPLVVEPDGDGSHPTVDLEKHADVPEPQGGMDATAQMGHSIRSASGVREMIRLVEARHDIPPKVGVQKLASIWEEAPQKIQGTNFVRHETNRPPE